jgi:hypothetical protein
MSISEITLINNPSILGREERYKLVRVDTAKTIKSWQKSLYSFEWLLPNGDIRCSAELPLKEHQKREEIERALQNGGPVERPVLGIGIMDNIEIGAGRAVFLTLAAQGQKMIEVHIPVGNEADFRPFLAH